ncbi:hypothetical protein C8R44DRAFT_845551 [Mycena epipterygia]|nr:hypothetical protein C8R44DRAFT_845551 [Mycena epipterygia]
MRDKAQAIHLPQLQIMACSSRYSSGVGRHVRGPEIEVVMEVRTAANLDEAIDTLQACLRVLDVVNRVGEMVREGKYWITLWIERPSPEEPGALLFDSDKGDVILIQGIERWKPSSSSSSTTPSPPKAPEEPEEALLFDS